MKVTFKNGDTEAQSVHILIDQGTWIEFQHLCRKSGSDLRHHLADYVRASVKAGRLLAGEGRDEE